MEKTRIFEDIKAVLIEGDADRIKEHATEALRQGIDPLEVVEQGLSKAMGVVGDRFERGEVFLPELIMATDVFKAAMEVLKPEMEAQKKEMAKVGTVLIGTVQGDVHDIGKNIVATVFETHGFSVVDMGVDVTVLKFMEEAEKVKADVIGLSSLMTNTMPMQRDIIETLKQRDLRNKYIVLVGGGPVNQEWADEIGADGYGTSAVEAVALAKSLLKKKQ
jgi:trimethylamine corrinoid protein